MDKGVSRGRTTQEKGGRAARRITPTADAAGRRGLRRRHRGRLRGPGAQAQGVARRSSRTSPTDALLCSNTSTLPITALAEGVSRPADFIGLHFFSPVDKMPLRRDHQGRADRRRGARPRLRPRPADQQDPDRRQRLARLLHLAGDRHVHQRGRRDGRRGHPGAVRRAGGRAGRLPGQGAVAHGRADPHAAAQDPQGRPRRGGGRRRTSPHPADGVIDRMVDEFGRPGSAGARASTSTPTASARGCGRDCASTSRPARTRRDPFEDMQERMLFSRRSTPSGASRRAC